MWTRSCGSSRSSASSSSRGPRAAWRCTSSAWTTSPPPCTRRSRTRPSSGACSAQAGPPRPPSRRPSRAACRCSRARGRRSPRRSSRASRRPRQVGGRVSWTSRSSSSSRWMRTTASCAAPSPTPRASCSRWSPTCGPRRRRRPGATTAAGRGALRGRGAASAARPWARRTSCAPWPCSRHQTLPPCAWGESPAGRSPAPCSRRQGRGRGAASRRRRGPRRARTRACARPWRRST
mmetsp:Transcript_32432/g.103229  ORF Transcript_32432/g.103229 Transcript_32432/m.103229 type:complete len:235 (+) Transcript_32432:529-1233(+)